MLHVETGRGLMALKYMKHGDIIVSIPENLLMTSQSVLSSSVGQVIRRFVTKQSLKYDFHSKTYCHISSK